MQNLLINSFKGKKQNLNNFTNISLMQTLFFLILLEFMLNFLYEQKNI